MAGMRRRNISIVKYPMLEFLHNMPSTTSGTTEMTTSSIITSSASSTDVTTTSRPSTLTKKMKVDSRTIEPNWSMPPIEMMETLYSDDRFDDMRECLLKYVYGDKWNITANDCPKTTTVLPEQTMITPIPGVRHVETTTTFTIPASFPPQMSLSIKTVNIVNAAFYNGRFTIVLLLISNEIHFN